MIKYPDSLPLGLISKNSIKDLPTIERTKFESGLNRQRKIADVSTSVTNFSFIFTSEQVKIFEKWFNEELNYGEKWFLIKRKTANNNRVEEIEARFKSMYVGATPIGMTDTWSVDFQAEVKRNIVMDDWWQFPDFVKYWCLIDIATNVCWPSEFPEYTNNQCIIDCVTNMEWIK